MRAIEAIHDLSLDDVPADVLAFTERLLLDLIAVGAVGATTDAGRIAARVAADQFGGRVPILFSDRTASPCGAAMAGAFAIDSFDAHDGLRANMGHAGCATLPSALSVMGETDGSGDALLIGMVLGYEFGNRAGMALHATEADYHTSGAWMALGTAAIAARAMGLSLERTRHALGIAEYHGPRSQMMRCIDHPAMIKDGSGWGAMAGVSAAYLAREGFTGAPALTVESDAAAPYFATFGERWLTIEQYVKPDPVCRWAQPAMEAARTLMTAHSFAADDIVGIEVRTFAKATRLACRRPRTTEEAQYSLPWPLAALLVRGTVGPAEVMSFDDPEIGRLSGLVRMSVDEGFDNAFPDRRLSTLTLIVADGRVLQSGPVEPRGDPHTPLSVRELRDKFLALTTPALGEERALAIEAEVSRLRRGDATALIAQLGPAEPQVLAAAV